MQGIREIRDHIGQRTIRIRSVNGNTRILIAVLIPCQESHLDPSENVNPREQNRPGEMNLQCMIAIIALGIELHLSAKLGVALKLLEAHETAQLPQGQCVHLPNQNLKGPL